MQKKADLFPMAATALCVAISIILSSFVVYIPLFGFPSVRFSFATIPVFIAGSLFGGVYGAIAGFLSDMIGFLFTSQGAPYHPGITINAILIGLIPGLIFSHLKKHENIINFNKVNIALGILSLGGAIYYINFIGIHEIEELGTVMGVRVNIVLSLLMAVLVGGLIFIVKHIQSAFGEVDNLYAIDKIIFISIINYGAVQLLCTPIWLSQMYNIPPLASITVRIFKSLIDIPLQVVVIYTVIKFIPQNTKGRYILWKKN